MADFALFGTRRFLPLFITQFFGAFNDNYLKQAIIILLAYRMMQSQENVVTLTNLAMALFILPYFLFSSTAGQLADKYDRAKLTRIVKAAEIVLMVLALAAFMLQSLWLLFVLLFFMGAQSTFFSPAKYSLLPLQLHEDELLAGNAFIEAGTFLAILTGTIAGGLLISVPLPVPWGDCLAGSVLVLLAIAGYWGSRYIPPAQPQAPELNISYNPARDTWEILRSVRRQPVVFRCMLGSSAFWMVGALYMSQLPAFCKGILGADATVVTTFMTVFSVGIGVGAVLCNKLLRGVIQTTYAPISALAMALFTFDIYLVCLALEAPAGAEVSVVEFLGNFQFWRLIFDMFMLAMAGGMFTVPLFALMQHKADENEMARVFAANNIINSLFIVAGALLVALLVQVCKMELADIFLLIAGFNVLTAVYVCRLLPDALLRSCIRALLTLLYRVRIEGLENFEKAGDRVLIIANHMSLLDGLLIIAFMPEKLTFAIDTYMARKWWLAPLLRLTDAYPMDPANPMAIKSLIQEVRQDRKILIFPEGRITVTGTLMKVYDGPGLIAEKSGALLLPVRIDGAQYSKFSYLKGKVRTRWFPQITLTVMPPRRFEVPAEITGRNRRHAVSDGIYKIMAEMMYEAGDKRESLFNGLVSAARLHGSHLPIAEDIGHKVLSLGSLVSKSRIVGSLVSEAAGPEKTVGLMLPNSVAAVATFFGLQSCDRIPAMINFTSGPAMILAGCRGAEVKTIVTSRRFLEQAGLVPLAGELENGGIRLVCLEDLQHGHWCAKLRGMLKNFFAVPSHARPDDPAVILFTSGSEGTPKGVVLSHRNLQSNRLQILSTVPITAQDRLFNCLPLFHSFGLSMGMVLPMLSGVRTFFYPSPLHYRIIPALSYMANTTIIFGTDTFLRGYGRAAHSYDFFNIRFALCGAERLRQETRELWSNKFGVRLFEGYGATEASPVISVNTAMYYKPGTVGRLLPGLTARLEPVPGIAEGGRLWLKGANIMLGYLLASQPGELQPPPDGWYDTGDIISIDDEGFLTIRGRAKRFAKLGGEMVSLGAVEDALRQLWPNALSGVVVIDDPARGEQLVLVTEQPDAETATLVRHFRESGLSELWAPKRIVKVKNAPLLGTGKFDYAAALQLVQASGTARN